MSVLCGQRYWQIAIRLRTYAEDLDQGFLGVLFNELQENIFNMFA